MSPWDRPGETENEKITEAVPIHQRRFPDDGRAFADFASVLPRRHQSDVRFVIAALVDALPALPPLPRNPAAAPGIALPAAVLARHVGEYKTACGFTLTFRRDGATLFLKPGADPEAPSSRGRPRAPRSRAASGTRAAPFHLSAEDSR